MTGKEGGTTESGRWTTGLEVWATLREKGGLDLQRYDAKLADDVRNALEPKPPATPLGLEAFLQAHGTDPEPLLSAFFRALQPFARMYADIYSLLERIGAKYGQENLRVRFNFDKAESDLEFDLHSFKEQIERWQRLTRSFVREEWNYDAIWGLLSALEFPGHRLVDLSRTPIIAPSGTALSAWLQQYDQGRWPDVPLVPPQVTSPTLRTLLGRVWAVWRAVVAALRHPLI
jgi:hypothetical protein